MNTIALFGAGGKMGLRIASNLLKTSYAVRHVEISPAGQSALAAKGLQSVTAEEALAECDVAILALPGNRIGQVTDAINPLLCAGTMLMTLDIAAPMAGHLPNRDDLIYFVTHPCHPSVFRSEVTPEAQLDFFGGVYARQNIVCSLVQGPEESYVLGEEVARAIFAPVEESHRCTPYQMAVLEPVLSETVLGTCLTIIREAMDEAVRLGVPEAAARDFLLGHLKVELGIVFQLFPGATFSDGALKAIEAAKRDLFRSDWKKVFETHSITESIRQITGTRAANAG